jgi:hypothetical protein
MKLIKKIWKFFFTLLPLCLILYSCVPIESELERNYKYYDLNRWSYDEVYGPNYSRYWIRPGQKELLHATYCEKIKKDLESYPTEIAESIKNEKVRKGMNKKQVFQAWGITINKHSRGDIEVWRYGSSDYGHYQYQYIYFKNGIVYDFGDSEGSY